MNETEEKQNLQKATEDWIGVPLIAYSMARIDWPPSKYAWTMFCIANDALYFRFFDSKRIGQAMMNQAASDEGPLVKIPYQDVLNVDFLPQKKVLGFIILRDGLIHLKFKAPVAVPPDAQTQSLSISPLVSISGLETKIKELLVASTR